MNGRKLWIFSLAFFSFFLLTNNNVQSQVDQCWMHSPTDGKDLFAHMIKDPPHRWSPTTVNYRINTSTEIWYGTDTREAVKIWNNSSYKGTATAFSFVYAGGRME
jgi:hypothetical protein